MSNNLKSRLINSFFANLIKHLSKCLTFAVCLTLVVSAQASKRPLFDDDAPIDAVLTVPLTQAYQQKRKDVRLYLDGNFSYKEAESEATRVPVKVKTRGNFRRTNCTMPPLRLNFPKKQVKDTLLKGQDKLKLVGPCQFGGVYKDLIGLEHLAYQIFQAVSAYSFKTRVLNLSYVDSDKMRKPPYHTCIPH